MTILQLFIGLWCCAIIFACVFVVTDRMKPRSDDHWEKYRAELELLKHWEECQASEDGCLWPDNCRHGDCRRVPDFTEEVEE